MDSQAKESQQKPQFKSLSLILKTSQKEDNFGNLYLGSAKSVRQQVIQGLKINAILTVMDQYMYGKCKISEMTQSLQVKQHKWVEADDDDEQDISSHFQQCYQFIDKNLKQFNVLVHCQAGISRSATIVIYYVMRKLNLSLQSANKFVVSKRHLVAPNQGFWNKLQIHQKKLRGINSQQNKNENMFRGKILDPFSKFSTQEYPQKFANHIVCLNNEGDLEYGNLFLGQYSILKSHFLKSLKINSVISVVQQTFYKRMKIKQMLQHQGIKSHLWLDIQDHPDSALNKHFEETFQFINNNLEDGNVLVHCQAGVSRSASIVVAYVIKKFKVNYQIALSFVQSKRKYVKPNEGFQLHLIQYSNKYTKD